MSFIDRLRLYIAGELSSLSSWVIPRYDNEKLTCDGLAEWEIVDNELDITYSCTIHLPDMVSVDTKTIFPNPTKETCKYCYSIMEELA